MAVNQSGTWLIAYDIRSPRRLRQVYRFLRLEAVHVQYSVFVTEGTLQRIGVLRKSLEDLIDPREDDVRIYRVPESPWIHTLGAQGLPVGAFMLSAAVKGGQVPFTGKSPGDKVDPEVDVEET